jgi:aminopeptidase N
MKIWIYVSLLLLIYSNPLNANIPWQILNDNSNFENKKHICYENCCENKYEHLNNDIFLSNVERRPYNVLSHDLTLDFTSPLRLADLNQKNENVEFSGLQIIKLVIDSSEIKSFELDANMMDILDVKISSPNSLGEFLSSYKNSVLKIYSITDFQVNDTLKIEIEYKVDRPSQIGLYMYNRVENPKLQVLEPILYTQSETSFASYWMPCNDKPYDKVISNVSIIVPEGFTGLSNGTLDSVSYIYNNIDTNLKFSYSHPSPISTYLITVAASKFSKFEQKYVRHSDNNDTIEIDNFMWDIDLQSPSGHLFNAKNALMKQPEMLSFFSATFGEYAFEKYGTVAVTPYQYGGMEHQTLTTIHRNWLKGSAELGLVHEVAHHWIGNLITCATWNDIWINEGGATWFEALWQGFIHNDEVRYYHHTDVKANYYLNKINSHLDAIYGLDESEVFVKTYLTYDKAGFVYHMLSEILGRENFIETLRTIFKTNKHQAVTTEDFINLIKLNSNAPKMDLDLFFSQWIYDSGHPIYDIAIDFISNDNNKFKYDVYLKQEQEGNGFREIYKMPLDIIFYDYFGKIVEIRNVYNDLRQQKFTFEFDQPVHKVNIDNRKVLCKISENTTYLNTDISDISIKIAPNPVVKNDYINILNKDNIQINSIKIIDILGNEVHNFIGNLTKIPSPSLSGMYHLVIDSSTGISTKIIIVI